MRKKPQQEIAAPESASDVKEAATEQQKQDKSRGKKRAAEGRAARFFTSKRITQYAVFIALALVMKLVGKSLTITPSFTVTFIYLPWLISGAVLGPIGGMIVGGLSDVLGNFIFGAQFIPLTFVSNTLYPLPVAILYKVWKRGNHYVKFTAGALASLLLCTLGIGSLALYTWYGYIDSMSFFAYLLAFRTPQVGVFAVNLAVMLMLIAPLGNVGLLPETEKREKSKTLVFTVGAVVCTALATGALIALGVTGSTRGEVYAVVLLIYAALMCQAGLALVDKKNLASAVLKSATVVLLYAALAVTLATQDSGAIEYLYLLLIAAAILAVIVAMRLIAYRSNKKKGDKRK